MTQEIFFYEFTLLPDSEQFDVVCREGEFISFREICNSIYTLYK